MDTVHLEKELVDTGTQYSFTYNTNLVKLPSLLFNKVIFYQNF